MDDIAKEIAKMPDDEFKANCEKLIAMCKAGKKNYLREQYIAWYHARADGVVFHASRAAFQAALKSF